jgi:hypothetical protein
MFAKYRADSRWMEIKSGLETAFINFLDPGPKLPHKRDSGTHGIPD